MELCDPVGGRAEVCAALNLSVGGGRLGGLDAQCHDFSSLGVGAACRQTAPEVRHIADIVICRKKEGVTIRFALAYQQGSSRGNRRSVKSLWLDHYCAFIHDRSGNCCAYGCPFRPRRSGQEMQSPARLGLATHAEGYQ